MMEKSNGFHLFLLFLVPCVLCESPESEASWADIQPDDGFHASARDIYILSQSNFTNCVLRSRDPWVVIPLVGDNLDHWNGLAEQLRGVAFFGTIDLKTDENLLSELNFQLQSSLESGEPLARVYPYGKANVKERGYQDMSDPHDIQATIVQSLPSTSMTSVTSDEDLNDFLMNCLLNSPTKFAVLFVVDAKHSIPGALLTISERLQRYFSFGTLDRALAGSVLRGVDTDSVLGDMDMSTLGLVVVIAHLEKGSISYKLAFYPNAEENGSGENSSTFTYFGVFKFLFHINSKQREYLPGNNMAEDEEVSLMEDAIDAERKRFRFITRRSRPGFGISAKDSEHKIRRTVLSGISTEL